MRTVIDRFRFPALVVLLIVWLQMLPGPQPLDDAHITFRYARNLANGFGFVYNVGQPVLGTTTPLYTLWLALFSFVAPGGNYPWLALMTNAICDVAAILLLRRLVHSLGQSPNISAAIAIGYLLNPLRIGVALGGMETSMVVLWMVAAGEAYVRRDRPEQAALFSGLAVLTRPDAILLPAVLAAHQLLVRRRLPIREGSIFLAIVAPWGIFAQVYFGSPLPHSVAAKSQSYSLHPLQAGATLLSFLATRFVLSRSGWPLGIIGVSVAVVLSCYAIGARAALRAQPRALPLVAFPPLYSAGLLVGNPLIFVWYYLPFVYLLDVFCLVGVWAILDQAQPYVRGPVVAGCVVGLIAMQWNGLGSFTSRWPVNLRDREVVYEQAALAMRSAIAPGSTVALPEIGVLGYVLDRAVIIDTVGLVSPEVIPYLEKAPLEPGQTFAYAISSGMLAALKPDYLVTLERFVRSTLLRSPDFLASYDLVQTFDANYFDSRGLLIFKRRASP